MNEITINNATLSIKEWDGKRVVTLKDIDEVHGRPKGTARKRFNDNKKHFIEGEDFYIINQPSEIRTLGIERPQGGVPESVTLITESGYLMLVKSFTDDLAWDVQRQLVNSYFRAQQNDMSGLSPMLQYLIQMEQRQNALEKRQTEFESKLEESRTETIKQTLAFGRIGSEQLKEVSKAVKKRAIEICQYSTTYDELGKRVMTCIYKGLQAYFDIPSYKDLRFNQLVTAFAYIDSWQPDKELSLAVLHSQPKADFRWMDALFGYEPVGDKKEG